jgi:hypothetical protein
VLSVSGEPERATKLNAFTNTLREKANTSLLFYIWPDYKRDMLETRWQL